MAIPRKHFRSLVVRERTFFWRVVSDLDAVDVLVVTEDAFVSGQRGQQLRAVWWRPADPLPELSSERVHAYLPRPAAVTPALVRRLVEAGLDADPPFTGRPGAGDVRVAETVVREVQLQAEALAASLDGS